jgi:hypothetical protein
VSASYTVPAKRLYADGMNDGIEEALKQVRDFLATL